MSRGWDDILAPDERVLWQGQPDTTIRLRPRHIPTMIFGFVFSGFALLWMVSAYRAGAFWLFGIIHFGAGLAVALGPVLFRPLAARFTWYSLTSKRAFVATDFPWQGQRLNEIALTRETQVGFDGGAPGTIEFGKTNVLVAKRGLDRQRFERIDDAHKVFGLIRDIQRGKL